MSRMHLDAMTWTALYKDGGPLNPKPVSNRGTQLSAILLKE